MSPGYQWSRRPRVEGVLLVVAGAVIAVGIPPVSPVVALLLGHRGYEWYLSAEPAREAAGVILLFGALALLLFSYFAYQGLLTVSEFGPASLFSPGAEPTGGRH